MKVLMAFGFVHMRSKGSHAVMRNGDRVCVVPLHDELATGTLRSILRQADISPDDFVNQFQA